MKLPKTLLVLAILTSLAISCSPKSYEEKLNDQAFDLLNSFAGKEGHTCHGLYSAFEFAWKKGKISDDLYGRCIEILSRKCDLSRKLTLEEMKSYLREGANIYRNHYGES